MFEYTRKTLDIIKEDIDEGRIFWSKMDELFKEIGAESPKQGMKFKECTPYVEAAIEKVQRLKSPACKNPSPT